MREFAGLLRERVEIWQRLPARLPSGVATEDWQFVGACLARIEAEGVGAASEAMAVSAMQRFRITIRSRTDVALEQRILWKNRRLIVRQIADDPATPDRQTLRCEELRT